MKKIVLLFLSLVATHYIYGQDLINTGALIQGGIEDGTKLVEAYVKPLNKAIVYGLSDVTYTKTKKAQKHKLLLSIKLAYINIPKEDREYDVTKLNLQNFEAKDPNQILAQTVFGDSLKTITLVSKDTDFLGRPLIEFNTPAGSQKSAIPLPSLSATYRLKYTNLSASFIPYINLPDSNFKIGMLGLSIQQDLALFIKVLKDQAYGISLQGSGAYLFGNSPLNIEPGGINSPISITGNITGPYDNQEINISYTSLNFSVYFDYELSKHLSLFSGGGFNTGSSHIEVIGTYPVYITDPIGLGSVVAQDVHDPLDISNTFSRTKLEIGVRGGWDRFFIQVNYNMATYGGIGLNAGYKML